MLSNFHKKQLDDLLTVCRYNLSTKNINENLITRAFKFSLDAHKNEKRASGEPYFTHPYEVAMIIAKEIPIDDITVTAALLHDVVEDTKFTNKDIKAEFGDEVAEIVEGATQIEGISENYEINQIESYKKMILSMASDVRVMLVKFADRIHNLKTIEFLSNPRQVRMAQETLEIYAPLAHRFGLSNVKSELEDLSFKCLDRKSYDDIAKKLKEKKKERDKFIRKFIQPIKEALDENNFKDKYEIGGRAKHIYSIYKKIKTRVKSFDEVYDLFAIRIILDTKNKADCFTVGGLVTGIYLPIPERYKNYIDLPKQNGYKSLHIAVMSKEGKPVEVQIRTREMHEVAEKGIAAHWKYKENPKLNDKKFEEWLQIIRESFESATKEEISSRQLIESFKMNLYQDEIYCFTPKGDLKVLPKGATPLDFAFEIHTQVGMQCIGAKVNGKIVPLDSVLKSGSQVEIITSKNSKPKLDWEKFVVTHKAKSDIRKYFNSEKREIIAKGKEIIEKKLKKYKIHINQDEIIKLLHKVHFKRIQDYYYECGKDEKKTEILLRLIEEKNKPRDYERIPETETSESESQKSEQDFEKFISEARATTSGIIIGKNEDKQLSKDIKYDYAKCCKPIPGDDVIGFITQTEGIKIHRKNCNEIINLLFVEPNRVIEINWGLNSDEEFPAGIKIIGEDKPGVLGKITKIISEKFKINIKNLNVNTKGSIFEGIFILAVKNLTQLNAIIEEIKSMEGIFSAERLN